MEVNQVSFGALVYTIPINHPVSKKHKNLITTVLKKTPLIKKQIDELDKIGYDLDVWHRSLNPADKKNELRYRLSKKTSDSDSLLGEVIEDAPCALKEVTNQKTAKEFLQEISSKSCKYVASKFRKLANLTKNK